MDGRLRWVEVDLNTPAWIEALGVTQVDAVLSTTALHWLRNDILRVSITNSDSCCGLEGSSSMATI